MNSNSKTSAAVAGVQSGASNANIALPTPGQVPIILTDEDFVHAADLLKCEIACVKAVTEVESKGHGFLPSGKPAILFEAHVFSQETKHQYDKNYPQISSPRWNRKLYKGGENEYPRLQQAMALNREAALQSASWGLFQIMGLNFETCGFTTVDSFVTAMYESEGQHLRAFVTFLQSAELDVPLREKRWADFARNYNGPAYRQNRYDQKLVRAYTKYQT